jgi:hypothetical protein
MKRVVWMTMLGAALSGAPALANNPPSRPPTAWHQLQVCMSRQMTASRTISYNDAAKSCAALLKAQNAAVASTGLQRPAGGGLGQ